MSPNKQTRGPAVTPGKHVYRSIRDPICIDAGTATPALEPFNPGADFFISKPLAPMGIVGVSYAAPATPALVTVMNPYLPFLWNTARNFGKYRVTRAVLIFVGSNSSTAIGRVTLYGTQDASDFSTTTVPGAVVATGAKSFDLASLANREARYNLPVDSSWKKVSGRTCLISGPVVTPCNTLSDLAFCCANITISGTSTVSGSLGAAFVEYDVEFAQPISNYTNA